MNTNITDIYCGRPAHILKITRHTDSEWSFLLQGEINYAPGSFVFVSLPETGEIPITISSFRENSFEITLRNVGSVTSQFFKLREGEFILWRGPYGNRFPLDDFNERHLVIIAGGSGVAAIKSLVEHYLLNSNDSLQQLDILLGFRTTKHLLYRKEIKHWSTRSSVHLTVDHKSDDNEIWHGGIGFVVDYVKEIKTLNGDTTAVVVGPPLMITNTVRELKRYDIKNHNIWTSIERHMQCGVGKCGHCRINDKYVCIDGPVFNYEVLQNMAD